MGPQNLSPTHDGGMLIASVFAVTSLPGQMCVEVVGWLVAGDIRWFHNPFRRDRNSGACISCNKLTSACSYGDSLHGNDAPSLDV